MFLPSSSSSSKGNDDLDYSSMLDLTLLGLPSALFNLEPALERVLLPLVSDILILLAFSID